MTGHHKADSKCLLLKLESVKAKHLIEMVEHRGMTLRIVGEVAGSAAASMIRGSTFSGS